MSLFALKPVLAAQADLWRLLIIALVPVGAGILRKITEAREQAERARAPKPPAPRPPAASPRRENESRRPDGVWTAPPAQPPAAARRDNPFRNEIEQFLEEVGRRRTPANAPQRGEGSPYAGPPPSRPVVRPQSPTSMPGGLPRTGPAVRNRSEAPKPVPQATPQNQPMLPGAELAQRKAPVSDDLGAQVRAHLNQYLESSRLSEKARADLGSAIDRAVRDHLGNTRTTVEDQDSLSSAKAATPIAAFLRNPADVRTAILVNEILQRPKCLGRKP